ncbi:MAG: hypothetical protein SVY15_08505 [Halobacteriota archaeon]|nr:hypothetical protein [Halobacteriota archaeon]
MNELYYILVFGISFFSFLILASLFQGRRGVIKWRNLASELGLEYEKNGPFFRNSRIKGFYRGYDIVLDIYTENRVMYTRVTASLKGERDLEFSIFYDISIEKLGVLLGEKIELDNPIADKKLKIMGNDEYRIKKILDQSIQSRISDLGDFNILRVKDGKVYFQEVGTITDLIHLKSVVDLICDLAGKI